jgi:hypothetical protein
MLGKKPKRVVAVATGPECPPALDYLWVLFCELLSGVPANGFTPPAPGWSDIAHWCALTGTELRPWEVRVIVMLGVLRAGILSEEKPKGS